MVLVYDIRVIEIFRLTASLSEALECLCVANRACDDDIQCRTEFEEHPNCSDQRIGGHFVVCLKGQRLVELRVLHGLLDHLQYLHQ
jgi:hypothetical protein